MSERRRHLAVQGRTIAGHLRILVFLCWAMLLVVSLTAVGSLSVQSDNIGRLTMIDGPALDANNQVRQAMSDAQIGLNGYQASGDRGLLQPYFGAHDRTLAALATLQGKVAQEAVSGADAPRLKSLEEGQRLAAQQWWAGALLIEATLTAGGHAELFQSRAMFDHYSAANAALGDYLMTVRDQTRLAARTMSSRGELVSVAATLAALLAMLVLGGRVAGGISRPLTDLRDAMVRQRGGQPGARAREDQGSLELRSVARDFNALSEQNLGLQRIQARDLSTQRTTLGIARAIRVTSETQQTLDVVCAALGEALGVDRVVANTMGSDDEILLSAQWCRPNLQPLGDLTRFSELGGLAQELWLSAGFRAQDDIAAEATSQEPGGALHQDSGARAAIIVPIGFDDRLIGMIYVCVVSKPRAWTAAETNVVHTVAGFVARAIVEAENQGYQREYVRRIETLDRQKSDFLATVSHELRTPLTSIMGYLELLQERGAGELSAQQHRMLEVINRNTVRLRSLIEDVMVLSRIEGGVNKADFVEVSIRALITRVGEELSPFARDHDVEFEVDPGPQAAIVLGEQASLDRAVVNILSNAIKFSRPGGVVAVTCALDQDAGRVLITCQDHGVGIPSQDLTELFTRFFRARNATDQSIPGTGLGLSIAKQIVEDHHGGELRLTSVENEGTTVVIDLPSYEPSQTQPMVGSDSVGNDSYADGVFGIRA
jgi:two-component system phosphate regulon sensor histidine kinase PhoR